MREPSLSDIICLGIVVAIVLYIATVGLSLYSLVVAIVVAVFLILLVRWAFGGGRV